MKGTWNNKLLKRTMAGILTVCMIVTMSVLGKGVKANEGYELSVTPSELTVAPGETVELDATVFAHGEPVTDLDQAGLKMTYWEDHWAAGHENGLSDCSIMQAGMKATVKVNSVGTYYIACELYDASWNKLAIRFVTITVEEAKEPVEPEVEHGISISPAEQTVTVGDTTKLQATVTYNGTTVTDLEAAGLHLWFWESNNNPDAVFSNYDSTTGYSLDPSVTFKSEGTYTIQVQLQDSNWTELAKLSVIIKVEPDISVPAGVIVDRVHNLSDDFIMGVDISSVPSLLDSGVTYKDKEGNVVDTLEGFCKILADSGVTHVRARVWNDPYDAEGNGYGGGNSDVAKAVKIAEACAANGLGMLVDFHCSDFWADPGKQQVPKAWKGYTLEQKAEAVESFIADSLTKIKATGVTVAMVQVGNETTNNFVGEAKGAGMYTLFNAGAKAVRAITPDAKVVIHLTNPERTNQLPNWAAALETAGVDYDVLATSYYPYWHGTFENLKTQLETVHDVYGKDVMVAETSLAHTLEDSDGHANTVRPGNNETLKCENKYAFTVQGQANFLRDLIDLVNDAGGLGVYYWEAAWLSVGDTTGLTGDAYDAKVAANKVLWEKYGSGWASSYASEYDPKDAGKWFGGSAVDNEALFDFDGTPLASLDVWKLVRTGSYSKDLSIEEIVVEDVVTVQGTPATLPSTVLVTYNNGTVAESVVWNDTADYDKAGEYTIEGTLTLSQDVTAGAYAGMKEIIISMKVTVKPANLITDGDDAGFEKGDNFLVEGVGVKNIPSSEDVLEGAGTLHWYNPTATTSYVTYNKVISLPAGSYVFGLKTMGFASDTVVVRVLNAADMSVIAEGTPCQLAGWTTVLDECQTAEVAFELSADTEIKLQIQLNIADGGWGSADAMYLYDVTKPVEPVQPEPPTEDPTEPETPAQPEEPTDVEEPSEAETDADVEEPTEGETDGEPSNSPDTGDAGTAGLWLVLAASAVLVLVGKLGYKKVK